MAVSSVSDVYQSLKVALDMFKTPAPETSDHPSKQALVQAAEQIKNDAAKIGLMCSGGVPPADQQASLATALQRSCVAFCTTCHAATATAGPSLRDSMVKMAQDLITACLALLKDMGSGKDLKSHVGLVWERVAAVSKAPADNKGCIFAALARVMAVLQDTLREMEELQEEQQEAFGDKASGTPSKPQGDDAGEPSSSAANGVAAGSSSSRQAPATEAGCSSPTATGAEQQQQQQQQQQATAGGSNGSIGGKGAAAAADGDVADLDYEADEMSGQERQLLTASLQLLKASIAVLKAFGKALLQGPALSAGSEALDGWESCLWHSKHLQRAVEDLGAAMYPPQDLEEVAGASLAVFEVTELMSDECPHPEAVGAEQLKTLNQQLAAAHQQVQQLLEAAQQQADS